MDWYRVAFDNDLTDIVCIEARDAWDAAELAANGLPDRSRARPADGSVVWVLDHMEDLPVWKGWRCMHRIEVSIGYVSSRKADI